MEGFGGSSMGPGVDSWVCQKYLIFGKNILWWKSGITVWNLLMKLNIAADILSEDKKKKKKNFFFNFLTFLTSKNI